MRIIDTHVHIGGDRLGFNMTECMVLDMMEKYKICHCIVSNCDSAELDHKQKLIPEKLQVSQEDSLKHVLNFTKSNFDRISAVVWVKPYSQSAILQLKNLIDENRQYIKAIKLHPYHSNLSPVDEKVLPFIKMAAEYELPVVSHTGGCEAASPIHVLEAAKMFPSIPFVMVHMGLGTDNKEALELLGKANNIYGDTTWVPMSTTLEIIKRLGSEKIMFGSDSPIDGIDTYMHSPQGKISVYQDYFYSLPKLISKEQYDDIMYTNAKRLFNIKKIT